MTDIQLKKAVDKYIKAVKANLICDYKTQKKFIGDLKSDIFNYINDNSVDDMNKVYEQFGAPEDIAKSFFANIDTRQIKRKINVFKITFACIISALIIWSVYVTAEIIESYDSNRGYIVTVLSDGESYEEGEIIADIEE